MGLIGIVAPEPLVKSGLDRFTGLSAMPIIVHCITGVIRSDISLSQRVSEQNTGGGCGWRDIALLRPVQSPTPPPISPILNWRGSCMAAPISIQYDR